MFRNLSSRQGDKADGDDEVDGEEGLQEEGEGVEGEPGQQLIRSASTGANQQEQIGEEQQQQKDQLQQDVLVPTGRDQPIRHLGYATMTSWLSLRFNSPESIG